jgi:transglutaminase-like putative cysteine protease
MAQAIKGGFAYVPRDAEGTQTPVETLDAGSGSCRDFALFMMEAARSLGLAARFVSGYLYDPATEGGPGAATGAGATHAWVDVYLPGAGWVEIDPTNGLVGSRNLIRVAVVRDPAQAVPLSGSWTGAPADYLGRGDGAAGRHARRIPFRGCPGGRLIKDFVGPLLGRSSGFCPGLLAVGSGGPRRRIL